MYKETSNIHTSSMVALQAHEFAWIKDYLYRQAGIVLNDSKQALVTGRLDKRLRYYGLGSYREYFALFNKPGYENEATMAIDLLTTNETYFFRENKHFEFLKDQVLPFASGSEKFRVWSAASSSGEEAYTLAMVLSETHRIPDWEIIGTDISTRVLEKARRGLYPMQSAEKIAQHLLKRYCMRGSGEYDGFFLINVALRSRVKFVYANLIETLPDFGKFNVIFLRNVMIYFDMPTKRKIVEHMYDFLRPGGYFIISHSESLSGMDTKFRIIAPSIYQRPE